MGVKVSEGRIAKGDKIRLLRKDEVLGESHVSSVRQGKELTSKIETGQEGGIIVSPFLDFTIGDVLISHS
jgi:translation initiation factor IF-2